MSMDYLEYKFFRDNLKIIGDKLDALLQKETQIMAQIDDLNAAITAEDVEVTTLLASITKIGTDVDALLAKIKAGGTATDLTNQIVAIQSHLASLTTGAQQLVDADTKANA